jgi:hypothetical protein
MYASVRTEEMAGRPLHVYSVYAVTNLIAKLGQVEAEVRRLSRCRNAVAQYQARQKRGKVEKLRIALMARARLHLAEVRRIERVLRHSVKLPAGFDPEDVAPIPRRRPCAGAAVEARA